MQGLERTLFEVEYMDQSWFEMIDVRRRRFSQAVWIPLRASKRNENAQSQGEIGFRESFFGAGSVAIQVSNRAIGEQLSWTDIGLPHHQGVVVTRKGYKPAESFTTDDITQVGIELVLAQNAGGGAPVEWHLNQDIVFALSLSREGDTWICPTEDFIEVVRLRRNSGGRPELMEIRSEFLKDYLAARSMALRLSTYWSNVEIMKDASHICWPVNDSHLAVDGGRFEGRTSEIHEGGMPHGSEMAVFQFGRNDIDPQEDVPLMGPPNDQNIDSESWRTRRTGGKLFRVEGEFWRDEWIEPAAASPKVRGDQQPSTNFYVVDAAGTKMSSKELNDEDIGRWLWFDPRVITSLANRRAGSLIWYTRETGGVAASTSYGHVHFGVNEASLVTVYAFDVAKLPDWEQRIWQGHNVAPNGKVSAELLASQVRASPAETEAPEVKIVELRDRLDIAANARFGAPLFRQHESVTAILRATHRFRATDTAGLLSLAKDLARLTADSINVSALQALAPLKAGENRGSLKSLEHALSAFAGADRARAAVGPLVGIYQLRLGDAHLPGEREAEAFALANVDNGSLPLSQGLQLLDSAVESLGMIAEILEGH